MSSLLIEGSYVHYEAMGGGRPVIFLHSWVGSWGYWASAMRVASASYRSYALDLWGFGDTTHNELKYSLDEQVNLLDTFLNELGIGKIAFVGHGLGALIAMHFANRFPQNVDRIMAVSCPLDYAAVNRRLWTASPQELSDWLSNRTPKENNALSDSSMADMKAIEASLVGLQGNNPYGNFRKLNIPCLFVYGEMDQAIIIPSYDVAISTFTYQVVFEGSGHFPMTDNEKKFNRLLVDFLALDSGISPSELKMKEEWRRRVR